MLLWAPCLVELCFQQPSDSKVFVQMLTGDTFLQGAGPLIHHQGPFLTLNRVDMLGYMLTEQLMLIGPDYDQSIKSPRSRAPKC